MARKIIVVGSDSSASNVTVSAFVWLVPPPKRGYRGAQKSRLPVVSVKYPWGLTAEEQAMFDDGGLVERVVQVGPFASTVTKGQIRSALEQRYAAEQAALDASAADGPNLVGDGWDGSAWTAA